MPITAWLCATCGGREVPLDHYATTDCGVAHLKGPSAVHPSFAAAVIHHDRAHYARGSGVVEVSNGLGCPREAGILLSEPVAVDPTSYNAAQGGTAWHGMIEESHDATLNGPDASMVGGLILEHTVRGRLGMVPIQGRVDCLRPARLLIEDWKTKTCWKAAGIEKDGPEPNDIAQLSLYAALVEQQDGWRPVHGTVWYRFAAKGLLPKTGDLMGEDAVLAYRPTKNETYTVLDLLRATDAIHRGILKWQDAPLVGEGMYYGAKTKCDYCPVKRVCWTQAKGAPF